MEFLVCTLWDKVADEASPLFISKTKEVAKRTAANTLLSREYREGLTSPYKDYQLRVLAVFDSAMCTISPIDIEIIDIEDIYIQIKESMYEEAEIQQIYRENIRKQFNSTQKKFKEVVNG